MMGHIPLPLNTHHLVNFVAFVTDPKAQSRTPKAATVSSYITALKDWEGTCGFPQVTGGRPLLLRRVLRGLEKAAARPRVPRRPWTVDMIRRAGQQLQPTANADHACLWAAITAGFFGLLRCGELTVMGTHADAAKRTLRIRHVSANAGGMRLRLPFSKGDPCGYGVDVPIASLSDQTVCPVHAMTILLRHRQEGGARLDDPLFCIKGTAMTRDFFIQGMRSLISSIGVRNPADYAGHSLRRGGASLAAASGLPEYAIQTLGRWKSDAYKLYIDPEVVDVFGKWGEQLNQAITVRTSIPLAAHLGRKSKPLASKPAGHARENAGADRGPGRVPGSPHLLRNE
jgi:hypothetical protein